MGHIDVQGIVSVTNGLPFVQFRLLDDEDKVTAQWQLTPAETRDIAQKAVEASMNAVYDAAIIAWTKEVSPNNLEMGPKLLNVIREYRADIWGLPDRPEDWRA